MSILEIYLDVATSGRVMAHLLEPPGLGVRFPSHEEMARRLPAELDAHLAWLRSHGEPVPAVPITFRVVEEAAIAGDFESGDDVGFCTPDAVPITPEDVEWYLRIGGYAHADLLSLVEGLDDDALDWVRDAQTRSIRQVMRHVVGAELWYMTRIIDEQGPGTLAEIIRAADARIDATEDVAQRLQIVWEAFPRFARGLTPAQLAQMTMPTWHTRIAERWTARKMLRRCIEHCREHTRNIERMLATYSRRGGEADAGAPVA